MAFNSTIFLFLALPIILGLYFVIGKGGKNILLFVVNILLYAFGEPFYILLLLTAMAINFFAGKQLQRFAIGDKKKKLLLVCSICINLSLLVFFKYLSLLGSVFNTVIGWVGIAPVQVLNVAMPIGISFFTFQAISYLVDIYRGEVDPCKNFVNFGVYFSFFAQITAGPIVRYKDIKNQLDERSVTLKSFTDGVKRFLTGLGQKVLFATYFSKIADTIFKIDASNLGGVTAWVGILFYALQIYFDFAGYSSMAIGIAKMFGFSFKENFNHPYVAKSIKEFWSRWHISLSTWFRDYVYFPLGGNRKGKARMYFGLFVVFALSGIWHGASLTFLVWGLYHAIFNILEKIPFIQSFSKKLPSFLQHLFTLLIVLVGWVFFRAPTIQYAFEYVASLFFANGVTNGLPNLSIALVILWIIGAIGSTNILGYLKTKIQSSNNCTLICIADIVSWIVLLASFALCIPLILSGGVSAFIYQQF